MTRFALTLAAAIAAAPAFAQAPAATVGAVAVSEPWARATAPGMANGAAYMTLSAGEPDRLVSASSPVAGKAEIHMHAMDGGIMRMREVEGGIAIAPGAPVELKPGGLHVMLMGLTAPLKRGESLPLTLTFEKAGSVTVEVPIQAAGARGASADGHGHGHGQGGH